MQAAIHKDNLVSGVKQFSLKRIPVSDIYGCESPNFVVSPPVL